MGRRRAGRHRHGRALNDWYGEALSDSADPRFDMRTLRTLTGGRYTREYGQLVAVQQSNGAEMRGAQVYDPLEVTVEGDEATAVICLDASSMEMYMTYTEPEEKVKPEPHAHRRTPGPAVGGSGRRPQGGVLVGWVMRS